MGKHVCEPTVYTREGADHTGVDAFLQCPVCGRRTETHVECAQVTPEVRNILADEWKKRTRDFWGRLSEQRG